MKRILLTVSLISILVCAVRAGVDPYTARQVAQNFAIEKGNFLTKDAFDIRLLATEYDNDIPVFYVFELQPNGFIVVSASKITKPILAFSFDNPYIENPALKEWITAYKEQIVKHEKQKTTPSAENSAYWQHYTNASFVPNFSKSPTVGPLITTLWNQTMYYNTYCPWDVSAGSAYDFRVPNGCVALACAMIMNYYRHPLHGSGGASYVPTPYPRQTVYFNQQTYYWDAMADELNGYTNEVAKLVYHIGVACQMGYSYDGSGAFTEVAAGEMAQHFGYNPTFRRLYAGEFTGGFENDYIQILKTELDSLRPILYSGFNSNGGHAFVLDGYQDNNYFHFNWGWGGSGNGYFLYDEISFNQNTLGISHLFPANNYPTYCSDFKRQTASVGYITDGSTNKPYQSNVDCQWMIAVPGASSYSFSFDRFDTEMDVDLLTFYNGPTQESGIAEQFSGSDIPADFSIFADSILITFKTVQPVKDVSTHQGFLIQYNTNHQTPDCNANNNVTALSGRISDGSSDGENYPPQEKCSWTICPQFVTGYAFTFPQFDLKLGDMIDIYDATTTPPTFWKRFDINDLPNFSVINSCPFSKMKVTFITDNFLQGDGFSMDYYAILGINENSGLSNCTFSPNPASSFVNVTLKTEKEQNVACKIIDVAGKCLYSNQLHCNSGENIHTIDVSAFASGIYFVHLFTQEGKVTGKIIIQ